MAAMVLQLQGVHRLAERLTQVDDRRWSLQKVYGNLVRVAVSEIAMLTKSDVQNTDTSGDIRPTSLFGVDSLSEMIGRVRPEAVSLDLTSLHLRHISKLSILFFKFNFIKLNDGCEKSYRRASFDCND